MATIKPKGLNFTTKELNAITLEQKGYELRDGGALVGRVFANGERVTIKWYFEFKWGGSKKRFYCAAYPNKSIKEIREIRDDARALVKQGKDPRAEAKVVRIKQAEEQRETLAREELRQAEALTVGNLFEAWIAKGVKRKDNNRDIIARFSNHFLPILGGIELRSLTDDHLIELYKEMIEVKKVLKTTIELHKDVGQMLRWASERKPWRKLMEENAAALVDISTLMPEDYSNKRERVLSEAEITRLYEVLKTNPVKESIQLAIWLCLSCTCRIGELLVAEWSHVDFDARTWFIPAANSKGQEKKKTDHTVYLSDFALDKFRQLKELAEFSPWCFPATYTDNHVLESSVSKAIGDRQIMFMNRTRKLQNRVENDSLVLGDEVWTVHDLRRTSSTMIQALYPHAKDGHFVAELCLHHKVLSGAALHYLHHDYGDQMRHAWDLLGERLELLTFNQSANVVTLKAS